MAAAGRFASLLSDVLLSSFQLPSRFKLRLMWPSVCCAFLAVRAVGAHTQAAAGGQRWGPFLSFPGSRHVLPGTSFLSHVLSCEPM